MRVRDSGMSVNIGDCGTSVMERAQSSVFVKRHVEEGVFGIHDQKFSVRTAGDFDGGTGDVFPVRAIPAMDRMPAVGERPLAEAPGRSIRPNGQFLGQSGQ